MNTWVLRLDHARWFRDELERIEVENVPHYVKVQNRAQLLRGLEKRIGIDLKDHDPEAIYYVHAVNFVGGDDRIVDLDFVVLRVNRSGGLAPTTLASSVLAEIALQDKAQPVLAA